MAFSGTDTFISMIDMVHLVGMSTWPADLSEFQTVFPEQEGPGWLKRIYRWFKDLF